MKKRELKALEKAMVGIERGNRAIRLFEQKKRGDSVRYVSYGGIERNAEGKSREEKERIGG